MTHEKDPAADERAAALARAMRENGVAPELTPEVIVLLRQPREAWPPCCEGLCDPCTLALQRAADRALALGWTDDAP